LKGKIHVLASKNISASTGRIFLRKTEHASLKAGGGEELFVTSE